MHTLIIKDLAQTAELDSKAMSAVSGGTGKSSMPYYDYGMPVSVDKSSYSFNAEQLLSQCQDTLVNNGNNVAFSNCIDATVNPHQDGKNKINIGYTGY